MQYIHECRDRAVIRHSHFTKHGLNRTDLAAETVGTAFTQPFKGVLMASSEIKAVYKMNLVFKNKTLKILKLNKYLG